MFKPLYLIIEFCKYLFVNTYMYRMFKLGKPTCTCTCTCTIVHVHSFMPKYKLGLRIRFECSNLCSIASHLKLNFSLWNFVATPTLMFAHVHLCNVNVGSIMAASISFLSPVILNPSRNSERNRLVILVPIMVRTILQIKTHANLRIFVCFC